MGQDRKCVQFGYYHDGVQLSDIEIQIVETWVEDMYTALSSGPAQTWAEGVKWCIMNDWQQDGTVAGLFLPSEQLMV